ncbi:MAG: hypothetical protein OIN88_14635 [Candidatus Methanoperedens sp.]|nr:hypothetical protein [Candidatus Methanoperedens sp.]
MQEYNFNRKVELFFLKLKRMPFILLGDKLKERLEKYHDLRLAMRQARIPMSYEMYLSNAVFYSAVSGLIGALFGLIMAYIVVSVVGLPEKLTRVTYLCAFPSLPGFPGRGKKRLDRQKPSVRSYLHVCT